MLHQKKNHNNFKAVLSQIEFGTYGHTSSNLIIQVMSDDGIIWPFPRFWGLGSNEQSASFWQQSIGKVKVFLWCLKEGRKCIKKSNWNGHGGVSMCACLRPIVQITQAVDRILIIVQWRLKSRNMCNFREAAETEFFSSKMAVPKSAMMGGCKEKNSSRVDFNFWGMYIHCNHLSIF